MENKRITIYDLIAHCKFMTITFTILAAQYDHDESDQASTSEEKLQAQYCAGVAAAYRKMSYLLYQFSTSNDYNLNIEPIDDNFNKVIPKKLTLNIKEKNIMQ